MRILLTIAHFYKPAEQSRHGSQSKDPRPRLLALSACLGAIHQLYGRCQGMLDIGRRLAIPANQDQSHDIEVVVCTTQNCHLLDQLPLPKQLYTHCATKVEPLLLGFECQAVLKENLGRYDYYCFLEDDLILHDPWFFVKLDWFTRQAGNPNLLQPNRYEVSPASVLNKVYVDGDLLLRVTERFQNVQEQPELRGKVMDQPVLFQRALNPHSGCYFLNAEQMETWVKKPYFLDRDTSFIGPLESAATLGIMKTFRVYKSAPPQAAFLEIQHFGTGFLGLLGKGVNLSSELKIQGFNS